MFGIKKTVALICAIALLCSGCIYYISKTASVDANPIVNRQVIIDAGHGGIDGGAEGLYQLVEKNINLNIALKLQAIFEAAGFEVIMTRTEDVSIYDDYADSVREKKKSDLENRLKIANQSPNAIMVSVHQNKYQDSKYSGAQVFYGEKSELSKSLAEYVQKAFVENIQPDNNRKIKAITSSVYLTYNAEIPAILAECGFLSNPEEAQKLATDEYQRQVAFTLFCGIMKFYENTIG